MDLQGLLSQLSGYGQATDEDKKAALNMGLLQAGLGVLMGAQPERGYKPPLGPALGTGGMMGVHGYNQALAGAVASRKADLDQAGKLLALQNEMRKQKMLEQFSGGGAASGVSTQGNGGLSYGPTALAPLATAYPEMANSLLKIWEAQNPNLSFQSGIPVNPRTAQPIAGAPSFPQTNQQGFSTQTLPAPDQPGGFRVGVTPGGAEAYALQQQIGERTKAALDPFITPPTSPTTPPIVRSRLETLTRQVPPASQGAVPGQADQRRAILEAELAQEQNNPDPLLRERNVKELKKQLSEIPVPNAAGMSPVVAAETERAKSGALQSTKNHADLVAEYEKKIPALSGTIIRLDRLNALNASDATYAGAAAEFKKNLSSIGQALGIQVDKIRAANSETYLAQVAELMKERLASKDYGSGTGVSNLDLIAAQAPLPELAKTRQGRQQIIDAIRADTQRSFADINAARNYYYDNNNSLAGFRYPSEQEFVKDQVKSSAGKPAGVIDFRKLQRGR